MQPDGHIKHHGGTSKSCLKTDPNKKENFVNRFDLRRRYEANRPGLSLGKPTNKIVGGYIWYKNKMKARIGYINVRYRLTHNP